MKHKPRYLPLVCLLTFLGLSFVSRQPEPQPSFEKLVQLVKAGKQKEVLPEWIEKYSGFFAQDDPHLQVSSQVDQLIYVNDSILGIVGIYKRMDRSWSILWTFSRSQSRIQFIRVANNWHRTSDPFLNNYTYYVLDSDTTFAVHQIKESLRSPDCLEGPKKLRSDLRHRADCVKLHWRSRRYGILPNGNFKVVDARYDLRDMYHFSREEISTSLKTRAAPEHVTDSKKRGKALFTQHCRACHYVQGELVAPPLAQMLTIYKGNLPFLYAWIYDASELVKAGVPQAVALFAQYNCSIQISMNELSVDDITDILLYLEQ